MTFRLRAAQQAVFAQAHSGATLASALAAKGFLPVPQATPSERLVDDARGKRSRLSLDGHGRLSELRTPLGRSYRFDYDALHRIVALVEPNGLTTALSYGERNLIRALDRGAGQRWEFEWDLDANLSKLTLPDGTPCNAGYSGVGELESTARGSGSPILVERDDQGRPTALTEATGARTSFEYGAWSQPDRTIRADGSVEELSRNAKGQIARASIDNELWYNAEYDAEGRVTAVRYSDDHFVQFAYNSAGQVTVAETPYRTVTLTCDQDGRVVAEQSGDDVVRYAYDAAGLLVTMHAPTGETVRFGYDDDGRLSGALDWQRGTHSVYYQPDGSSVTHHFPNGLASHTELLPSALPREVRTAGRGNSADLHLRFNLNGNGQLTGRLDSEIGTRHHAYDDEGRLQRTQSQQPRYDEFYAYDGSGNRRFANGVLYESNASNQTTRSGDVTSTYDRRGNLATQSGPSGTTYYRYNGQNLLVEVKAPSGLVAHYQYDAFGRRIRKSVGSVETTYVWAQEQLIREVVRGDGWTEQRDYLFVPGSHARYRCGWTARFTNFTPITMAPLVG